MQKIDLHPLARREMFEAAAYYDDCRDGLGTEFLDDVETIFSLILAHSRIGRPLRHSYRRVLLLRFPYGVVYRQNEEVLYVVAVAHVKRKPGYWLYRTAEEGS